MTSPMKAEQFMKRIEGAVLESARALSIPMEEITVDIGVKVETTRRMMVPSPEGPGSEGNE